MSHFEVKETGIYRILFGSYASSPQTVGDISMMLDDIAISKICYNELDSSL